MRICLASLVTLILASITLTGVSAGPQRKSKCDLRAHGPSLDEKQRFAIKDYSRLLWGERDARAAFDAYVPGEFIQHNPTQVSGREEAISFLDTFIKGNPTFVLSNLTSWAGEGIGSNHYRVTAPTAGFDIVVFDRFRFKGTCFVEHWDVIQFVTGNETNPIAFF